MNSLSIDIAQKLGFNVIAEYVETQEQVDMLKAAGCFQYQGYLFSPAVDYGTFVKRYHAQKQTMAATPAHEDPQ